MTTWLRSAPPWCLAAVVLLAAGCGSSHATAAPAAPAAAAVHPSKPIWLQSLQMTSAGAGWALYNPTNPANPSVNPPVLAARTTDGARTWTDVTPAAARPLLATPNAAEVLDAVGGERAYLAVTGSAQESASAVNTTLVFSTDDGGRTWTKSARLRTAGLASLLSFADSKHGWLVLDKGAAMGRDAVTGPELTGGEAFLTVAAVGSKPVLLVSRDLGQTWAALSLPALAGMYPRIKFFGRSAGVLVAAGAQGALGNVFYTTADGGRTWRPVRQGTHFTQLGAAIDFVSPRTGFAWITGGETTSGSAPKMYVTGNSGRTWTVFAPRLAG